MGDPLYNDVKLLYQYKDPADGGTGMADYGPSARTITYEGGAVHSSTFLTLDGTDDAFTVTGAMPGGTGPICVEVLHRIDAGAFSGTHVLWTNGGAGSALLQLFTTGGALKMQTGATVTQVVSSADLETVGHEYTFQRDGSGLAYFFVDGNPIVSWADTNDYGTNTNLTVGRAGGGGQYMFGRMFCMRITPDTRYAFSSYVPDSNPWPDTFSSGPAAQTAIAAGFMPVNFGTPTVPPPNAQVQAAGFKAANFGTPAVPPPPAQTAQASPLRPVQFGVPTTPTFRAVQAQGFRAARFGTPAGSKVAHRPRNLRSWATALRPVKFGTPNAS
jgi:hypothetical protein